MLFRRSLLGHSCSQTLLSNWDGVRAMFKVQQTHLERNHLNTTNSLLNVHEVSQLLHVHENTLRRGSDQGIIKAYRIGPRHDRRYKQEDIAALLIMESRGSSMSKPKQLQNRLSWFNCFSWISILLVPFSNDYNSIYSISVWRLRIYRIGTLRVSGYPR